jgi:hypothetical protein
MSKLGTYVVFGCLFLLLIVGSLGLGQQRRQRRPWSERSPAVGKKVPEVMVYDKNLNKIPLSNLYKDAILVIQWGGCT